MRFVLFVFIIIYGLIHLLGFAKAFNISGADQLSGSISKPAGIFWLLTTFLFSLTAVFYFLGKDWWWITGSAAVIISQILIISSWHVAKFGTIAN